MKIALLAPSPVPFLIGGAEKLYWGLHRHMNQLTPHEVELIKEPCRGQEFWPLMEAYERISRLDLGYFDMVITTKYPAWMVRHPNHHLYLQHTCRGVYDLYHLSGRPLAFAPTRRDLGLLSKMLNHPRPDRSLLPSFFSELFRLRDLKHLPPDTFAFPGPLTRAVIRWLDRIALSPEQIKTYSAISANVAEREGYFPPGVPIEVIHHPTDLEGLHCSGHDYLFTASRLEGLKRIDLLIEAFKSIDTDIELRIAGTGGQEERLKKMAASDGRIKFLGFITDLEMVDQYAGALFCPFVPYDEDYGLITVEAMQSSKAVLTVTDSGGVKELVKHGENGMVVSPNAGTLARAMEELISDRERTIRMGLRGKESVSHINWPTTVSSLLREKALSDNRSAVFVSRRKKMVVVTTFPIWPPLSGGQKRIYHLYREVCRRADVVLVTLSGNNASSRREEIAPGLTEVSVPKSEKHIKYERDLESRLGAPVGDIAAMEGYRLSPEFKKNLSRQCRDADMVVASHPYLYDAIREVFDGRLWYEAQDVEYDMKAAILPPTPEREHYLERVKEVERRCSQDAERILSVSEEDKARLMEMYGLEERKILIVPNGMDFRFASLDRLLPDERRRLKERLGFGAIPVALFMGSYHGPNIEGLKAIKKIASECPEFLCLIVGSVCLYEEAEQNFKLQTPNNVKLLGVLNEDEKNVVLNGADMALNPVVAGSGSNLKLLEYIAYGIPVITTPHGNRGYGLKDKTHLFVAEIKEFSFLLRDSLSADPLSLQDMAEQARQYASSRYDWSVIASGLHQAVT